MTISCDHRNICSDNSDRKDIAIQFICMKHSAVF
ncbi:Ubiquitin-activating enzyme E1 [Trichinella pseudospiralis]